MARIGFDLDGCLVHFTRTFQAYVLGKYPEMAEHIPDVNAEAETWDWFLAWPDWDRDRCCIEMDIASSRKQLIWIGEPYDPDLKQKIQKLRKQGHTIHVITHRFSERSSDATHQWVNHEMGWVNSITLSKDKTVVPCDYFLEDNADNVYVLRENGTRAFLINRAYNLGLVPAEWSVNTLDDFILRIEDETSST